MSWAAVVNKDKKPKTETTGWPEPDKIDALPDIDPEIVPESFGWRNWNQNIANTFSVPLAVPAVLTIHSMMSLIGSGIGICTYKNNTKKLFYPNTFGGLVALPGSMKSDIIDACYAALDPINRRIEKEGATKAVQDRAKLDILNEKISNLKAELKNGVSGSIQDELTNAYEQEKELQKGVRGFISQDSTVEAEQVTMAASPRGVLMLRDELAGWFKSLEKKGQEGSRTFMLEAWNGNRRFKIKRIGRGESILESATVSVTGSIQPAIIESYMTEARNPDSGKNDGLIQRMQMLVYPDPMKGKFFDGELIVPPEIQSVFDELDQNIPFDFDGDGEFRPLIYEVDDSGYQAWEEWINRWMPHYESQDDLGFRGHLSKYRSLIPSLALCFAILNQHENITGDDIRQAAAWGDYLQLHAHKLYFGETTKDSPAGRMIAAIKSGKIKNGITVKAIRDGKMLGRNTARILDLAIGALTDSSWIRIEEAGRGSRKVHINPKVNFND